MRKFQNYSGNIVLSGNDSSKVVQNGKDLTRRSLLSPVQTNSLLREEGYILKKAAPTSYSEYFLTPRSLGNRSDTAGVLLPIICY